MRFEFTLVFLLTFVAIGCGRDPVRPDKPKGVSVDKGDVFRQFIESVRYSDNTTAGDEWIRCRSGLDLLALHFVNPDVVKGIRAFSEEQKKFLESKAHLTEDELAEVESTTFRTADAHYLDECFLLNDALRSLELGAGTHERQAEAVFRWVMRNVYLHEQGDTWTPPAFTLRRGHGGALERALVFLAMLRQARIEGCLIVVPDAEIKQFLVGVADGNEKAPKLRLYDTRLGLPLFAKDGVSGLSLADAPAHLAAAPAKKLEAWLVCPLYAMPPRLVELQKGLSRHSPITLHMRASDLAKDIGKATSLPVKVWNPRVEKGPAANSPTRCLRLFLPKQEGGIDESNRAAFAAEARMPLASTFANYAEIRFTEQLLPRSAHTIMTNVTVNLLNKYELQPREMYLRGQYDPLQRRQERLQHFTQDESLVGLVEAEHFRADLRAWQTQLALADSNATHENAKLRAKAQQDVQALWNRDQFIGWMLELNKEEKLEKKHEKTVLTRVLAVGMREHLDLELTRLQASVHHEKAVVGETLARRRASAKPEAEPRVHEDWGVARDSWRFYVERVFLDGVVDRFLSKVRAVPPHPNNRFEQIDRQIGLLETLHQSIHKYFHAKLAHIECLERIEGSKAAAEHLRAVKAEIEALEKKGGLPAEIKLLMQDRHAIDRPRNQKLRLTLLARDWGDDGNLAWLKRHIDQRLSSVVRSP